MILVDTSVWVEHLRRRHARLAELLEDGQVVCHPFVIGELSLGGLARRDEALTLLQELPNARLVSHHEASELVERRRLFGTGIGWVDVHLLASALIERRQIWTLDRRLAAVARDLGVAFER